ncbi:Larval mesenchyme specific protein [Cystobacter fuscus DSM 2262]|uniref:Larval mesenchyme specific protein n=1 Tax=Cystobacter fuscus (strain ATCC 25194 / DSM 2262 / NBRC 100088 / M29) TaxID=1242864 RepID=S9PF45_CYSF2|nr:NAD(P)-binding domain-containing protein [Cystobacter fuscus]EPX60997.1 Larval mesenchyme specific protein [Cystobacter fuscus DSM 2262]
MDYLIIGAGPAGLQLGYLLAKTGRSFRILEAGCSAGTFFKTYPRHRTLISSNKVYNGTSDPELNLRMDWNSLLSDDPELLFTKYTDRYFPPADVIVKYLSDFASKTQLPIEYDTRVTRVSRAPDGGFRVETQQGRTFEAKRLIAATGVTKHNIPPIPGIEHAELYGDVSVDPKDFINKRVLIIGKGNSAFETADNLISTAAVIHVAGPSSIRMAWRTHYVGHLRAVNNNFLDTYQLKSQNALLDGNIQRIEKQDNGFVVTLSFSRANEVTKDLRYDRIILCTGFRFDASIFDENCRPELVIRDRFPNQTAEWESTNVPGLHFAGTIGQVRDFKKSTGGFIHGFRYSVRALHRILERKYHGAEWPHQVHPAEPDALMEAVLARVNRSSGLWQQFSFLGDSILVGQDGQAKYLQEVPLAYTQDSSFGDTPCHFTVSLEYGPGHADVDPFDVEVGRIAQNDAMRSGEGRYLHPVVRCYHQRELVATHHVTENLENDWTSETVHRAPLRAFFERELAKAAEKNNRPAA